MAPYNSVINLVVGLSADFITIAWGTIVSGFLVTIGEGWGKIRFGDREFISFWRAFLLFILELFIIVKVTEWVSPYIETILYENILYLFAIDIFHFTVLLVWFCYSFSFRLKSHLKAIVLLLFLIIANLLLVNL